MILWWIGNALLVAALPIVLMEAIRIIRSLAAVKAAARDIAGSVKTVSGSVPGVVTAMSTIAVRCEQLGAAFAPRRPIR